MFISQYCSLSLSQSRSRTHVFQERTGLHNHYTTDRVSRFPHQCILFCFVLYSFCFSPPNLFSLFLSVFFSISFFFCFTRLLHTSPASYFSFFYLIYFIFPPLSSLLFLFQFLLSLLRFLHTSLHPYLSFISLLYIPSLPRYPVRCPQFPSSSIPILFSSLSTSFPRFTPFLHVIFPSPFPFRSFLYLSHLPRFLHLSALSLYPSQFLLSLLHSLVRSSLFSFISFFYNMYLSHSFPPVFPQYSSFSSFSFQFLLSLLHSLVPFTPLKRPGVPGHRSVSEALNTITNASPSTHTPGHVITAATQV